MSSKYVRSNLYSLTFMALLATGVQYSNNVYASTFDEGEAIKAVHAVVAEHKIYATCLSLDSQAFNGVREVWRHEVMDAEKVLKTLKPTPAFIVRYTTAIAPSRLLDDSMKLSEAIAYCKQNEKQFQKFYLLGYSRLVTALESATKKTGMK
jgi:hypothetical protein